MTTSEKKTPLYEAHARRGAKFTEFGGWRMPVQYSGILQEHLHTRSAVSLFDISHMGEFLLTGPGARRDVGRLISSAVERMQVGQCRYGLMLDESGGILDDLITCRSGEESYMLVVNAATTETDAAWIQDHLSSDAVFCDISQEMAKIDVQGPRALELLSDVTDRPIDRLAYFHVQQARLWEFEALISRTGYTGELGYELYVAPNVVETIWERLLMHPFTEPAGLGARDTLRLEMGYPLYGQELGRTRTPLEAGLDPYVRLEKAFIGRDALLRRRAEGISQILVGLLLEGRQSARPGFPIMHQGERVGAVTSGSFSPSLGRAIGLGYVGIDQQTPGTRLELHCGKHPLPAEVVSLPFYKKGSVRRETTLTP
ncbi:MAG: glycine cleavage system aminomethyltransferase GcvT [Candidatus Latescibacterota bacterium]